MLEWRFFQLRIYTTASEHEKLVLRQLFNCNKYIYYTQHRCLNAILLMSCIFTNVPNKYLLKTLDKTFALLRLHDYFDT
jgi:hypothetical protein